ncbi:hypothetical protein HY772_08310 [Candidatus Woesearchaeota archaeon]|nr:hypothetical protein [Candidatus Woesearchaeota archaeon]
MRNEMRSVSGVPIISGKSRYTSEGKTKWLKMAMTVMIVAVLVVGCATHPKDYKETITSDIATEQIGRNTTHGIVGAVIGSLGVLYTYSAYQNPPQKIDEEGNVLEKDNVTPGVLFTLGCFGVSSLCFKAAREWESELRKIERTSSSWPLEKSWDITGNTSLKINYSPINFYNNQIENSRQLNVLSVGLTTKF